VQVNTCGTCGWRVACNEELVGLHVAGSFCTHVAMRLAVRGPGQVRACVAARLRCSCWWFVSFQHCGPAACQVLCTVGLHASMAAFCMAFVWLLSLLLLLLLLFRDLMRSMLAG
jgi:hypothetical protein